jgi:hypothetical protein
VGTPCRQCAFDVDLCSGAPRLLPLVAQVWRSVQFARRMGAARHQAPAPHTRTPRGPRHDCSTWTDNPLVSDRNRSGGDGDPDEALVRGVDSPGPSSPVLRLHRPGGDTDAPQPLDLPGTPLFTDGTPARCRLATVREAALEQQDRTAQAAPTVDASKVRGRPPPPPPLDASAAGAAPMAGRSVRVVAALAQPSGGRRDRPARALGDQQRHGAGPAAVRAVFGDEAASGGAGALGLAMPVAPEGNGTRGSDASV